MQNVSFSEVKNIFTYRVLRNLEEGKKYLCDSRLSSAYDAFCWAYEACSEIKAIKEQGIIALPSADVYEQFTEDFISARAEIAYYYSLSLYYNCEYDKALDIADSFDNSRCNVIIARCCRLLQPYAENRRLAFFYMQRIENDSLYMSSKKNKYEEELYVRLIIDLSEIYRVGAEYEKYIMGKYSPYEKLQPDIKRAMNLLISIQDNIHFDKNKTLLSTELARYKKKLFGGYKYVQLNNH